MSIIKNTISIMVRDGLTVCANLVVTIILARSLGPELLGIWFIYLTIFSLLDTFLRTKSETSSVFFLASGKFGLEKLEVNLLAISLFSTLLGVILFLFSSELLYQYFFSSVAFDYRNEFKFIFLTLVLSIFATVYFYLALGSENYKLYNFTILSQAVLNLIFVVLMDQLFHGTVWVPIISINVSWGVAALIGFLYYNNTKTEPKNFRDNFDFKVVFLLLKSGLNFYLSALIKAFQDHLPRLIILGLFPVSYLAFLGQSQIILNILIRFSTSVGNVLYPRIASLNEENQKALIQQTIRVSIILNLIFFLSLYLLVRKLVIIIYGVDYLPIVLYLKILIPSSFIFIIGLLLEQYINGRGDFIFKIIINLVSCISMAITLLIFYSSLSPEKIAISIAVSNLAYTFTAFFIVVSKYKMRTLSFIPRINDFLLIIEKLNQLKRF